MVKENKNTMSLINVSKCTTCFRVTFLQVDLRHRFIFAIINHCHYLLTHVHSNHEEIKCQ